MKKKFKVCIQIVFLLILVYVFFPNINTNNQKNEDKKNKINTAIGDTQISSDYIVNANFESNLPLVVIDLGGASIPNDYYYDEGTESFEFSQNKEQYANGIIKVIDNEDGYNKLSDDAKVKSKMKIKYRGNSSIMYDKKQYGIKLITDENEKNKLSIMGMDSSDDWILNGSIMDKSLIRNYLALKISSEIMENTPEAKYCEMVIKKGNLYEYEGLYLMMEKIEEGKDRVEISNDVKSDECTSYIIRRDRDKANKMTIYTDITSKKYKGSLEIKYPSEKNMNEKLYNFISNDINKIERILYSDDKDLFETYDKYIDEDSFVDYFIINEFFMNYDAGNYSTYFYKSLGEKLKVGPVWDFDMAIDNYSKKMDNLNGVDFISRPWFDQLIKSKKFTEKLVSRYDELRKYELSDKNINQNINEIVKYLGNAQLRDYSRWKKSYDNVKLDVLPDKNNIYVDRNYFTFEEEIQRVKDNLYIHGNSITAELKKINNKSIQNSINVNDGLVVIFIIGFFGAIVIIRRTFD